jgi:hypothetical protein
MLQDVIIGAHNRPLKIRLGSLCGAVHAQSMRPRRWSASTSRAAEEPGLQLVQMSEMLLLAVGTVKPHGSLTHELQEWVKVFQKFVARNMKMFAYANNLGTGVVRGPIW